MSSKYSGKVYWSELITRDVEGAKEFYRKTCGWTYSEAINGEYYLAMLDGNPVTGIMDMSKLDGMDDIPAHWFTYLAVDDINATVQECRGAGAGIIREPLDVPNFGRIAVVSDPTGAVLGFIEPSLDGDGCDDEGS